MADPAHICIRVMTNKSIVRDVARQIYSTLSTPRRRGSLKALAIINPIFILYDIILSTIIQIKPIFHSLTRGSRCSFYISCAFFFFFLLAANCFGIRLRRSVNVALITAVRLANFSSFSLLSFALTSSVKAGKFEADSTCRCSVFDDVADVVLSAGSRTPVV